MKRLQVRISYSFQRKQVGCQTHYANKYINKFLSKNESSKNDGYNFLDRYERLTLANRIYTHLMEIRYKLEVMTMMCQYSGINELFFAIDPASWAAYFTGINMVDGIINDWKGLGV